MDRLLALYGQTGYHSPRPDELPAKLGAPAIPHLVRLMDFERQPANFRAAGALGRMGKSAWRIACGAGHGPTL